MYNNYINEIHAKHIAENTGVSVQFLMTKTYIELLYILEDVISKAPVRRVIKGGESNPITDKVMIWKDDSPIQVVNAINLMITQYSIRIINEHKPLFIEAGYIKENLDSSIYY